MRRIITSLAALLTVATVGLAAAPTAVAGAGSNPTPVVVTSADLVGYPTVPAQGQFVAVNEGDGTGAVSVISNGETASQGSLQMSTTGSGSHWSVFNEDQAGTALSAITSLSYTTNTNDTGDTLDPSLQLVIDPGNTTGLDAGVTYSTLNYEPYLQSSPIVSGTWQTWNALDGVVWGTHLSGAPNADPISWSTFVSDYPNATILGYSAGGGVGFNVGSGWSAMVGNVGDFTFGTSEGATTYTFDPTAPTTSTTTTPASPSIVLGNGNTDSATVTGNPVVGSPTGSVSFYVCGPTSVPTACTSTANQVGTAVGVTPGPNDTATAASVAFTPPTTGYWCFAGDYSGDSNYAASSDATTDECFDVTTTSSTSTAPTIPSIVLGNTDADGLTVTGNPTSGAPTGTVKFYECGPTASATPCTSTAHAVGSTVNLTVGSGDTSTATSAAFTPTAAGYWCFSGHYSGDFNYEASTDTTIDECFHVTAASSSTVSATSSPSVVFGSNDSDSVTVTGNAAGGSPTGSVQFYACGPTPAPTACTSTSDPVSLDGVHAGPSHTAIASSEEFTPTSAGYWCFAADYLGSSNYTASNDATTDECFLTSLAPTSVTTSPTNATIQLGQSNTDSATVHGGNAIGGSPPGTVTFYECGPTTTATSCTSTAHRVGSPVGVTSAAGNTSTATSASFTPTAVGYWCFAAYYSGNTTQYASSADKAVSECVNVKGPVTVVTKSLPSATEGHGYTTTLAARGGTAPYTWSHTGSLPRGIKMDNSTGVISGTPSVTGSFPIVVKVKDSGKPATSATQSLTLVVNS